MPRFRNPQVLVETLEANAGGTIIQDEWLCDVIAANAEVIALHNEDQLRRGLEVPPKFRVITAQPTRLIDLLTRDCTFLAQGEPSLRSLNGRLMLVDVAAPYPQSEYVHIEIANDHYHIIYFRGTLLHLIHSTYSKIIMLLQHTRYDGCLEQHRPLLAGDAYSDLNLLVGFFNDIEVLFDDERLFVPISPAHLNNPYDYCENVEGARRFLLAHELGHAFVNPAPHSMAEIDAYAESLSSIGYEPQMARAWSEEFWCDKFALYTILDIYENLHDRGQMTKDRRVELCNALAGIFLLFSLLEMAQLAVQGGQPPLRSHPPEEFRLQMLWVHFKTHPLYPKLPWLADTLRNSWRYIRQVRTLVPFHMNPQIGPKLMVAYAEKRLSAFGYNAYRAILGNGPLSMELLDGDPTQPDVDTPLT